MHCAGKVGFMERAFASRRLWAILSALSHRVTRSQPHECYAMYQCRGLNTRQPATRVSSTQLHQWK